jgi:hypothetical protein
LGDHPRVHRVSDRLSERRDMASGRASAVMLADQEKGFLGAWQRAPT